MIRPRLPDFSDSFPFLPRNDHDLTLLCFLFLLSSLSLKPMKLIYH